MLKKLATILLSITLLLTLCTGTGVFAAVTTTNGAQTENFEDMTLTDNYFAFAESQLDNISFIASANSSYEAYKIVEKTGADGKTSKMLEMRSPVGTSASQWAGLRLPQYESADLTEGEMVAYSFDFYIESIPESKDVFTQSPYFHMFYQGANGGLFSNSNTFNASDFYIGTHLSSTPKYQANLTADKWYRAEAIIGTDASGYLHFAIYDENGTAITKTSGGAAYNSTYNGLTSSNYQDRFLGSIALGPVATEDTGFTVLMDNLEYSAYKTETGPAIKSGSYFTESSIKNNDVVSLTTNSATVVFDQQLADGFKAHIASTGETATECTMTAVKAYANSYSYTVALPELEASKNYTLSFSDCKNTNGVASTSTITFKTEGAGPAIVKHSIENEISPLTEEVEVTFDQPLSSDSKVVVYKEGGAELDCILTNTTGNTYTITLPYLEDGTDYTLDFTGCKNASGASCSDKVNFKTTIVRIVKLTDDFENNLVGADNKGYNTGKDATNHLYSQSRPLGVDTISMANGYNGNAIQISTVKADNDTDDRFINALNTTVNHIPEINPADNGEYEKFVLTYRFNIDKKADCEGTQYVTTKEQTYNLSGSEINFYTGSGNSLPKDTLASIVNLEDGSLVISARETENNVTAPVEEDHWYNIVWVIDGENQTFNFIDEETGKLIFTHQEEFAIPETGHCIVVYNGNRSLNSIAGVIYNQNQTVLIDDFTFWKIKPWMTEHKLTANVTGTSTIDMSFNQPVIAAADMFDTYKVVNDENIPVSSTPEFIYNDFCEISVSYKNLRYMTDYVVDYSDVKSAGGAGFRDEVALTRSFNKGKDPAGLTLIGDISYDALGKGAVITAKMQKDADGTASVIAAFYKGNVLLGIALNTNETFTKDVQTDVTLTLENDMSEADTIKVFGWNAFATLVPTMSTYVEVK